MPVLVAKHTERLPWKHLSLFAFRTIQVGTSDKQGARTAVAPSGGNASEGGAAATLVDPLPIAKVRSSNEQDATMATSAASSVTPTAIDPALEGKAKPKKDSSRRRSLTKKEASDTATDRAAATSANASASKEEEEKAATSPTPSSSRTERENTQTKASKHPSPAEKEAEGASVDVEAAADRGTSKGSEEDTTMNSPTAGGRNKNKQKKKSNRQRTSVEREGDGTVATGVISVSKEQGDETTTSTTSAVRVDDPVPERKAKPKKGNSRRSSVEKGTTEITPPIDEGFPGANLSTEGKEITAEHKSAGAGAGAAVTAAHAGGLPPERKYPKTSESNGHDPPADQVPGDTTTTTTHGVPDATVVTSKDQKEESGGKKTPDGAVHAAGSPSERIKAKPKKADTSPRSSAEHTATGTGAPGENVGAEPSKEGREGAAKSSPDAICGTGSPVSERKEPTRKANQRQTPATTRETEGTATTEDEASAAAAGVGASKKAEVEEDSLTSSIAFVLPPGRKGKPAGEVKQTSFDLKTAGTKSTAPSGGGVGEGGGAGATGPGAAKGDEESKAKTLATEGSSESTIFDRKTMTRKAKTPSSIVEKRTQKAIANSAVSRPLASLSGWRPENPGKKLGRRNSAHSAETRPATSAQSKGEREGEADGGGADIVGASGITPTPPKQGSNPISSVTPPRTGSRGGNLAVSSSCSSVGEGRVSKFH